MKNKYSVQMFGKMFVILIFGLATVLTVNSQVSSNLACVVPTILSSTIFGDCAAGTTDADNIQFYVATRANPNYNRIYIDNDNNMEFYNPSLPTYFIIHGWVNTYDAAPLIFLKNQWLKNFDANIISVDWSCLATDYFKAATVNIQTVGFYVGKMILHLANNYNLQLSKTIVFGHSLGAHIAGFSGKYIISNSVGGEKLGYIAAADAAGPCITLPIVNSANFRLDPSDATYVQASHCTDGVMGTLEKLGSANIYFNSGTGIQCGCGAVMETDYINQCAPSCSHNNCLLYFIYSLTKTNSFKAKQITTSGLPNSYTQLFQILLPIPTILICPIPLLVPSFYADTQSTYMQVGIHGERLNGDFIIPTRVEAPHCYPTAAGTCTYSAADSYSGGTVC